MHAALLLNPHMVYHRKTLKSHFVNFSVPRTQICTTWGGQFSNSASNLACIKIRHRLKVSPKVKFFIDLPLAMLNSDTFQRKGDSGNDIIEFRVKLLFMTIKNTKPHFWGGRGHFIARAAFPLQLTHWITLFDWWCLFLIPDY